MPWVQEQQSPTTAGKSTHDDFSPTIHHGDHADDDRLRSEFLDQLQSINKSGMKYMEEGRLDKALHMFQLCETIIQKTSLSHTMPAEEKSLRLTVYNNIACVYQKKNALETALQYLFKVIEECGLDARQRRHVNVGSHPSRTESSSFVDQMALFDEATAHLNACVVLSGLKQHKQALRYVRRAVALFVNIRDPSFVDAAIKASSDAGRRKRKNQWDESGISDKYFKGLALAYYNEAVQHEFLQSIDDARLSVSNAQEVCDANLGADHPVTKAILANFPFKGNEESNGKWVPRKLVDTTTWIQHLAGAVAPTSEEGDGGTKAKTIDTQEPQAIAQTQDDIAHGSHSQRKETNHKHRHRKKRSSKRSKSKQHRSTMNDDEGPATHQQQEPLVAALLHSYTKANKSLRKNEDAITMILGRGTYGIADRQASLPQDRRKEDHSGKRSRRKKHHRTHKEKKVSTKSNRDDSTSRPKDPEPTGSSSTKAGTKRKPKHKHRGPHKAASDSNQREFSAHIQTIRMLKQFAIASASLDATDDDDNPVDTTKQGSNKQQRSKQKVSSQKRKRKKSSTKATGDTQQQQASKQGVPPLDLSIAANQSTPEDKGQHTHIGLETGSATKPSNGGIAAASSSEARSDGHGSDIGVQESATASPTNPGEESAAVDATKPNSPQMAQIQGDQSESLSHFPADGVGNVDGDGAQSSKSDAKTTTSNADDASPNESTEVAGDVSVEKDDDLSQDQRLHRDKIENRRMQLQAERSRLQENRRRQRTDCIAYLTEAGRKNRDRLAGVLERHTDSVAALKNLGTANTNFLQQEKKRLEQERAAAQQERAAARRAAIDSASLHLRHVGHTCLVRLQKAKEDAFALRQRLLSQSKQGLEKCGLVFQRHLCQQRDAIQLLRNFGRHCSRRLTSQLWLLQTGSSNVVRINNIKSFNQSKVVIRCDLRRVGDTHMRHLTRQSRVKHDLMQQGTRFVEKLNSSLKLVADALEEAGLLKHRSLHEIASIGNSMQVRPSSAARPIFLHRGLPQLPTPPAAWERKLNEVDGGDVSRGALALCSQQLQDGSAFFGSVAASLQNALKASEDLHNMLQSTHAADAVPGQNRRSSRVIDFDDTIDGHDDGHGDDGENHRTVLTTAKFVAKGLEREHKRSQKLVELIEQNMAPAKELKSADSLPYMY